MFEIFYIDDLISFFTEKKENIFYFSIYILSFIFNYFFEEIFFYKVKITIPEVVKIESVFPITQNGWFLQHTTTSTII